MLRRLTRTRVIPAIILLLLFSLVPAAGAAETEVPSAADRKAPELVADQSRSCLNLDLRTGTTQPFVADAFGTPDPDWWVTATPDTMTVPAPAVSITPVPSWFATPAANWVDARGTGFAQLPTGYVGMDAAGWYTFATSFTLNGAQYTNGVLHVNTYAADNEVWLYLNGSPIGGSAGFGPPVSTPVGSPFTVPLAPGTHTLEARVRNDGAWAGLLVDAHVTADCTPDVTIEKRSRDDFVAGQPGTYMLMVSNSGMGPAAGPITVVDTLPAGAGFISAAGSGWTCSFAAGTVTCVHSGPLAAQTSLPPILITVTMPVDVDQVENCASVDVKGDANPENNRSCTKDPVDSGRPASVCGVKFNDLNGNGTYDSGEPGLANWSIEIRDAWGNVIGTVTTGRDGSWCLRDLKPGLYTVSEVQQNGWTQTAPLSPGTYTVALAGGQVMQTLNFGNRAKPAENCCLTFRFPAGRSDNFGQGDGAEPASPSPGLVQFLGNPNLVNFDYLGLNRIFAHTFTLPQGNCIEAAALRIRVRPNGSSLNSNDTIGLRFIGANGSPVPGTPSWGAYFGTGNPGTAVLGTVWSTANYPAGQWITLDLSSLPGGGNLVPALNSLRYLDLLIQDDTALDSAVLAVKFCECAKVPAGDAHGQPKEKEKEIDPLFPDVTQP